MLGHAIRTSTAALGIFLAAWPMTAEPVKPREPAKANDSPGLAAPVRLQVAGEPLNIGEFGCAAPFVCDFDGDGNFDLLVGVQKDGVLRIHRNTGTNEKPTFERIDLFQAAGAAGSVPWRQGTGGFTPQFIDFDGDGKNDMLSGCYSGQLYFFKGKEDRKFADGVTLSDSDGNELNPGYASTVFAVDSNGDGKLDLLLGNQKGEITLMLNEGEATKPAFKTATKLAVNDKEIRGGYESHPIACDWDGDGKLDLLVGNGDGSVHFYKNTGEVKEPKLVAPVCLVGPGNRGNPTKEVDRGNKAKICVFDWNKDGKLDLLVGDMTYIFPDKAALKEADKKALDEAKKKLADVDKEQKAIMDEQTKLSSPPRKQESAEEKAAREEVLKKAQAKHEQMTKESSKLSRKYAELIQLDFQGKLTEEQKAELETLKTKIVEAVEASSQHFVKEIAPHLQPPSAETPEAQQVREAKLEAARMKLSGLCGPRIEAMKIIQEFEGARPGGSVWLFLRK